MDNRLGRMAETRSVLMTELSHWRRQMTRKQANKMVEQFVHEAAKTGGAASSCVPVSCSPAPTCKYMLKWSLCGNEATHMITSPITKHPYLVCADHAKLFHRGNFQVTALANAPAQRPPAKDL